MSDHDHNIHNIADVHTVVLHTVSSPIQAIKTVEEHQNETFADITSKKRRRPRIMVVSAICLLVLIIGGGVFSWSYLKSGTANVTAYRAHTQNVSRSIGGSGILYSLQTLTISYPIVERVLAVYVKPGDRISPNQSLIQLDLAQLDSQIKQASDDVSATQNYLNSVSSYNQLTVSEAQRQYDLAVARYNSLVAQRSSPTFHNGTLVSPLKGVVTTVNIDPGEVAAANSPLMTLSIDSTLVAHVDIPLANFSQVYIGQHAIVTPSALPDQNFQGIVSTIVPQASSNADTFEVWVNINNTKNLLPNMNTFVRLQEPLHAIVVPRLAVINPDQGAIVFVIREKHAYLRHIQLGGYVGDLVIVSTGLAVGDQVVLTGASTLQDGQSINVSSIEQSGQ